MKRNFLHRFLSALTIVLLFLTPDIAGADATAFFTIVERKDSPHWEIMGEFEKSRISMKAANCYISWINAAQNGGITEIETAEGFSVRAIYRVNQIIGLGIGYERFWAETSGSSDAGHFKMETYTDGILAIVSVHYPLTAKRISVNGEMALGYYIGNYKESENSWNQEGDDSAAGIRLEGKVSYAVTPYISIVAGGGYRVLKMDGFGVNFLLPGHREVEMDYSGWFAGGGINVSW